MRNELTRIRGLATDIVLTADDLEGDFDIDGVREMAEEIVETAGKLVNDIIEIERADILAEHVRCV
jgi:hypothetical protein